MGNISHFDIDLLKKRFGLEYFVETGVGKALSLVHVVNNYPFRGYYSCDWDELQVRGARYCLRDSPDVQIAHARSTEFLETLLSWLPKDKPILFWLDAHFPDWCDPDDPPLYLPLANELKIIARLRPEGKDVVAIDDLAIYLDGQYDVPLDPQVRPWCPEDRNIDFVHEAIGGTHDIRCLSADGGYILATPKAST